MSDINNTRQILFKFHNRFIRNFIMNLLFPKKPNVHHIRGQYPSKQISGFTIVPYVKSIARFDKMVINVEDTQDDHNIVVNDFGQTLLQINMNIITPSNSDEEAGRIWNLLIDNIF